MLVFLALPLFALIVMGGVPQALGELNSESAREAIWLSVKTTVLTAIAIAIFGTPLAYWIGRSRGVLRKVFESLVELGDGLIHTALLPQGEAEVVVRRAGCRTQRHRRSVVTDRLIPSPGII